MTARPVRRGAGGRRVLDVPGLGPVSADTDSGGHRSAAVDVPVLGRACEFRLDGYRDDPAPADFRAAVAAFLGLDPGALADAAPAIFDYYADVESDLGDEEDFPVIPGPEAVLAHVRPGPEAVVARDPWGDRRVYISVECECSWEPEHGLQLVFRDGRAVTKVGPYDGHLTHANAYDRDDLDGVVYPRFR